MMFKCCDCGEIFSEPLTKREDFGYNTELCHIPYYEYVDYCPECGSDDIEEYREEDEE